MKSLLAKRFKLRVGLGNKERLCLKTTAAMRMTAEDAENCGSVGQGLPVESRSLLTEQQIKSTTEPVLQQEPIS